MADQDRRVRRTRRTLREALIALTLEKGYERVTVQDILNRADVGRSTFYAHYRDKESLLIASFDALGEQLRAELHAQDPQGGGPGDPARPAAALYRHAYRHRAAYKALCGKPGGTVVYTHLHRLLVGLLRVHLQPYLTATGSDLPADVVAEFYTSAALGLLVWWIKQNFAQHPDALAEMYRRLAAPGVLALLGSAA